MILLPEREPETGRACRRYRMRCSNKKDSTKCDQCFEDRCLAELRDTYAREATYANEQRRRNAALLERIWREEEWMAASESSGGTTLEGSKKSHKRGIMGWLKGLLMHR